MRFRVIKKNIGALIPENKGMRMIKTQAGTFYVYLIKVDILNDTVGL